MNYSEKTTICTEKLPANLLKKRGLKLVIINSDPDFVKKADTVAQQTPMGIERYVIWVKSPDIGMLRNQIPELPEFFNTVIAFSLSTINKLALIMSKDEPINELRIDRAYFKAGSSEYNHKS